MTVLHRCGMGVTHWDGGDPLLGEDISERRGLQCDCGILPALNAVTFTDSAL